MQVFQLFSPFFARFRPFSHCFLHFWPPGPTPRTEPAAGTQKQGPGARAGRQRRPKAACGRRRTARAPRPGAPPPRAPGGAAPNGGAGARRRATAGRPARQERAEGERIHRRGYRRRRAGGTDYPEPPQARRRRRGGRRVGDSGAGGQRPGGPAGPTAREKRAGREPTRPAAYRAAVGHALRGAEASRWVPPDQSTAAGVGEGPGGGPPAQTPQTAQRRPRAGRRRD